MKTDLIFANLSHVGKLQTSVILLKLWYAKLEKISAFSLNIFVGMSISCEVLETSKSSLETSLL